MIGPKSSPLWQVVVNQYSKASGTFIRAFFVEVNATSEDLAGQAALAQINKWALGDFSVNTENTDKNARLPFIRYGIVGARNRIVSIKRLG